MSYHGLLILRALLILGATCAFVVAAALAQLVKRHWQRADNANSTAPNHGKQPGTIPGQQMLFERA
jgi:hypothetical protein